jgi:hypothetical protein
VELPMTAKIPDSPQEPMDGILNAPPFTGIMFSDRSYILSLKKNNHEKQITADPGPATGDHGL